VKKRPVNECFFILSISCLTLVHAHAHFILQGLVVNMSSAAAQNPSPLLSQYAGTKVGLFPRCYPRLTITIPIFTFVRTLSPPPYPSLASQHVILERQNLFFFHLLLCPSSFFFTRTPPLSIFPRATWSTSLRRCTRNTRARAFTSRSSPPCS